MPRPPRHARRRTPVWNWLRSTLHNARGVAAVVDLIALRRLGPRLIAADHPWATGLSPHTGRPIWPDNVAFASARGPLPAGTPGDPEIVAALGRFLASMVGRSASPTEIPHGPRRRMPHAVNYIHGTVHYNGVFLVFDDLADATWHLSDSRFAAEMRRLAREERREITIACRRRDYREADLAFFLGFLRGALPWYANGNGPRRRVLYGGRCGFLAVNTINGSWIRDMRELRAGRLSGLVRPPLPAGRYFRDAYRGDRRTPTAAERVFAWVNYRVVRARGFQGGLVFTRRRRIEPRGAGPERRDGGTDWPMPRLAELIRGV